MPIYEYRCAKCGDFEVTQRITESALSKCPTCKRKVERLISNTSFQLKGSGWYVTDYARKGGGKSDKSTSDSTSSESTSSTETKSTEKKSTETKSDTKGKTSAAA